MRAAAAFALLALAACAAEPEHPFEKELGPPPGRDAAPEPVETRKYVNLSVGSHGPRLGGGIVRRRGNFSYGIGF